MIQAAWKGINLTSCCSSALVGCIFFLTMLCIFLWTKQRIQFSWIAWLHFYHPSPFIWTWIDLHFMNMEVNKSILYELYAKITISTFFLSVLVSVMLRIVGSDHEFINKEYISIGMRPFGEAKKQNHESLCSKWTISYCCGGSWFLTWYQSYALYLAMSIESSNIEQRSCEPRRGVVKSDSSVKQSTTKGALFEDSRKKKSSLD